VIRRRREDLGGGERRHVEALGERGELAVRIDDEQLEAHERLLEAAADGSPLPARFPTFALFCAIQLALRT
jgi:hypothetical protein